MSTSPATRIPPPASPQEVSDGIYAWIQPDGTWWINNTGFLIGRSGVTSIDTCSTEARTNAYLAAIANVTDKPVRTLINTHHHSDHTNGNYLLPAATVVGHQNTRTAMLGSAPGAAPFWSDVDWGDLEVAPPFLTYQHSIELWVDDLRCEVRHLGRPAHTDNDSIIWIPERELLFSGDLLFNGGTPFLLQGSVTGARQTIDDLRALNARTIVPGHGPVCGPEVFDTVAAYLDFVLHHAALGQAGGIEPLELARNIELGPFSHLTDPERLVGNLHRAYADVAGSNHVDATAALQDMVTYNGGQPLICLA